MLSGWAGASVCHILTPHPLPASLFQAEPTSPASKSVHDLFRTEVLTPFQEDLLEKSKEIYNGANILITGATGSFGKVHMDLQSLIASSRYAGAPVGRPSLARASKTHNTHARTQRRRHCSPQSVCQWQLATGAACHETP
jgi:hypothetical protein